MIPAFCRTRHDPESGTFGDCLRACVASILELNTDEVPHFYSDGCDGREGQRRLDAWLQDRGLTTYRVAYPDAPLDVFLAFVGEHNPHAHYILQGSIADGGQHVVVAKGGKIVHNPAWYGARLVGPIQLDDGAIWQVTVIIRA